MAQQSTASDEKSLCIENAPKTSSNPSDDGVNDEKSGNVRAVDPEQSAGVQKMEAITIVWTKPWLVTAFVLIWLISFTDSLQQQSNSSWMPYVTSAFQLHGLTGITTIVANLIGGVSKLPLSRFIDVVGRPQGFLLCLGSVIISLILMATCQNVQTYCAAQVFYWTGFNGIGYIMDIFIADTSKLTNRAIWLAFRTTPYICNTFAGPKLAETILKHSTWRWGYGAFTIITPFMCMPFLAIFYTMSRRAKAKGVVIKEKSGRTILQSIKHWCLEFDVIGLLLICSGVSTFLLPFSLEAYQRDGWRSSLVINMIVFGLILLALFAIWERFWAPKTFFPFYLMTDRSVVAACFLGCNTWITFYSYKPYFNSYLQVVFQLSVAKAGYITNIFNIGSVVWSVVISFAFKYTDRYKWAALIAIPLQFIMTGLMIHYRQPSTPIALLVMIEVLGSMASGTLVMVEQLAVMAAVPHENLATGIALLSMITAMGGAIGNTISAAIWTHIVPTRLHEYLPAEYKNDAAKIYGDIGTQVELPWDSEERRAIVHAYADAQKYMVIVGTCALIPCFLWGAMLRNYRLSEHQNRKGVLI
ncbi:major facilitator superfamily domain-containing protein [Lophiotrema nucula]|uniref:Major facilitator superfamily domain-containing protein n=1 Tax=Lophiotrema nucula TaxID=690887 RepID=A0A6A5YJ95_9PLEO|nr:major facilitator superfamily domain-containing protein [Lophiotrema nucula]